MPNDPQRQLVIQGFFQGQGPAFRTARVVLGSMSSPPQPALHVQAAIQRQQAFHGPRAGPLVRSRPFLQLNPQPFQHPHAIQVPAGLEIARVGLGQPLPPAVCQRMESLFGTSFSDVRIHSGPQASSLGAVAFTMGSKIFFAPGQYAPHSPHGQRLLAHELTHVVQQRAGRVRNPFGTGVAVVQDPGLEAEAERMGLRVAMTPAPRRAEPHSAIAQKPIARTAVLTKLGPAPSRGLPPGHAVAAHVQAALAVVQSKVAPPPVRPPSGKPGTGRIANKVVQGLILIDDDLDTTRLLAAFAIYKKWNEKGRKEHLGTLSKADLSGMGSTEKLYLVAHGSPDEHGDRSAGDLATLLKSKGLRPGTRVKLISCNTGDNGDQSYAAKLAKALKEQNTVIGIQGLETSKGGHTRANTISDEGMKLYEQVLAKDTSFAAAEKIVKLAKEQLAKCQPEEEEAILLEAAVAVEKTIRPTEEKLEKIFKEHVTIASKSASEYIHPPALDPHLPLGHAIL